MKKNWENETHVTHSDNHVFNQFTPPTVGAPPTPEPTQPTVGAPPTEPTPPTFESGGDAFIQVQELAKKYPIITQQVELRKREN